MPADVVVVMDRDARETLFDLGTPALLAGGQIVLDVMRRTLPRSRDGSNGRPPGYANSRLRILNVSRDPLGPYLDVGTDATSPTGASYPSMLEHGTRPHLIRSHGNYPLRDRHGRVFGREVHHPGTAPIPWARTAAAALTGRTL